MTRATLGCATTSRPIPEALISRPRRALSHRLVRPASRRQDDLGLTMLVPGLAATIALAGASRGALAESCLFRLRGGRGRFESAASA
jgi:hypothetical protein